MKHFPIRHTLQRLQTIAQPTLPELPTEFSADDLDDNYGDFLKQHAAIRAFYKTAIENYRVSGVPVDAAFLDLFDDAACDCFKAAIEGQIYAQRDAEATEAGSTRRVA